jgi:hypothetical protein
MSPVDNVERRIEQLHLKTSADTDKRVLVDAHTALRKGLQGQRTGIWQFISTSRIARPIAAAAVLLIIISLFLSRPARDAGTIEGFYSILAGARNICVSEFRAGQTSPDQQVWTSLSLKKRLFKTGTGDQAQFALWDVDKKVEMRMYLSTIRTEPLTEQKLLDLEKAMTSSFVLAPFFAAKDVPEGARWSRVKDPAIVALIPGCVVYDLTWITSAGGTEKKWRVFADARSHLPRRTELYVKSGADAEYVLKSFVVVTYPGEDEIQDVVANTFGRSGTQTSGPEYIGTPGIDR